MDAFLKTILFLVCMILVSTVLVWIVLVGRGLLAWAEYQIELGKQRDKSQEGKR